MISFFFCCCCIERQTLGEPRKLLETVCNDSWALYNKSWVCGFRDYGGDCRAPHILFVLDGWGEIFEPDHRFAYYLDFSSEIGNISEKEHSMGLFKVL